MNGRPEINIFDTKFINVNRSEACAHIEDLINERNKFHYIAVKDVALTVRSLEDNFLNKFYKIIPESIFVDGKGLTICTRMLGVKFKEMVGGPGIYYELLKIGENRGLNFFFLGGTDLVLSKALANVLTRHPRIKIVGYRNGYFNKMDENHIVQEINKSCCDVLFLGISTPKREQFIYRNIKSFSNFVCISVGGVFDNEAGETAFAPKIIANMGLEWFYRVLQEPRRLSKRYFYTHSKFFYYLFKEYLSFTL